MISVKRLDRVASIIMGQAPAGESYNTTGDGWPLIAGAGDFKGGKLAPVKHTIEASKLSEPGDIVLSIRASIGDKVMADDVYCLGRGVAGIRASRLLSPRYLWHWLTSVEAELVSKGRGATFKQVNRNDIGELTIPVPSLAEQKRIAEVLDQADALLEQRRQAIALLNELALSVFHDMFGYGGVDGSIGQIEPLAVHLSEETCNGLSPSKGGNVKNLVLTLSAVTGGSFDGSASKWGTFKVRPPISKRVDRRDFLVCRGNGNLNLVGLGHFPDEDMPEVVFPDTMIALRVDPGAIGREYLEYVWNTKPVRSQIETGARTTNGTFKINQSVVESLLLPVPPVGEQEAFGEKIRTIKMLQGQQSRELTELGELFASLQARAFRGEL